MEIRRLILFATLGIIGYFMWNNWQLEHPVNVESTSSILNNQENNQIHNQVNNLLPKLKENAIDNKSSNSENNYDNQSLITIKTDVMELKIDTMYGDVVYASLLNYPVNVNAKGQPTILLTNNSPHQYVANSGLLINQENFVKNVFFDYKISQKNFVLNDSSKTLEVVLEGKTADDIFVKKIFTITKGNYLINVRYEIDNKSATNWQCHLNAQLLRSSPQEDEASIFRIGSYTGSSYSNPQGSHYQKISFKKMLQNNLNSDIDSGWIAMQQHYFLSSWIPDKNTINKFYTKVVNNDYIIGFFSQPIVVKPGANKVITINLYVGPEIADTLNSIAPHLGLTIDYGFLWFLSSLLFSLMNFIYNIIGNWGWSIVLVTILIKLAFYHLSATSYRSMAGMRNLQPKLQSLRERFGDDKVRLSQATMELYRQEKIKPLGGCLPIVIQIPVFIALYWVLLESVALRQSSFIFWINDLSAMDPFHVLPVIMGITMLIQQRLNPTPPDPMQAKVMMFLPVLFTALFWNFPSGLVLYWIVNNTLSILQQWYITHQHSNKPKIIKKNNFKKDNIKIIN